MPDIRQNTVALDDFDRADENPIGSPWAGANAGVWAEMALSSSRIMGTATPPTSSGSYWTTEAWDDDEAECWGVFTGTIGNNEDCRVGLMRDDGVAVRDGYTFHQGASAGGYWEMRRYDNGSGTQIAYDGSPSQVIGEDEIALIRRNGNDVEGWLSEDGGASWTLILSATDTTYMTDLHGMLGAGGNVMGWKGFGGGPQRGITPLPQIIRRTHRRGGFWHP